jgi:hypothetical protein
MSSLTNQLAKTDDRISELSEQINLHRNRVHSGLENPALGRGRAAIASRLARRADRAHAVSQAAHSCA